MKKNLFFVALIGLIMATLCGCGGKVSGDNTIKDENGKEYESYRDTSRDGDFEATHKFLDRMQESKDDSIQKKMARKVYRSEETNRPRFDRYFEYFVEVEAGSWNDEGVLVQSCGYVTYGRYNDRMNQSVCAYYGKEKCEKIAKEKGWVYTDIGWLASMSETEDSYPIDWWILDEALSKI